MTLAPRVLLQLALFALPFILFGLYRLAVMEAEVEGRKPWPLRVLFGAGLVLAVGSWMAFIVLEDSTRDRCYEPQRLVDGEIVGGTYYDCQKDIANSGVPNSRDPGGSATGVGDPRVIGNDSARATDRNRAETTPIDINEDTAETLDRPDR
ncbi:MAG: hypothetical protein AAGF20_05415 [Pseudomonadota bacterium]